MSYGAIYEVTRSLRQLLHGQLTASGSPAEVTLLPPGDTLPEVLGVNLYLYRVVESPFMRNQPWPGDRTKKPSDQPALALQLSYLLTPLGTKPQDTDFTAGDDAHTMLGAAMLLLHEHPVLNDIHLPIFDADVELAQELRNSYEKIKVCLAPVGLDELSKIWATINKPYRLSVAYEVSLVELTPTAPPPAQGGIVTYTNVTVITRDPPRVFALTPPSGALARLAGGAILPNQLQISGFGFRLPGQAPIVEIGGEPTTGGMVMSPPAAPLLDEQTLTVPLPIDLRAGPQADVQVTLNGTTSAPLPFTVSPWLASLTPLRTALDPNNRDASGIQVDLQLTATGNGFTLQPHAVHIEGQLAGSPPQPYVEVATFIATDDTQAVIDLNTVAGLLINGLYKVRIVLADGSVSNARTLEVLPLVNSPIGLVADAVAGTTQITISGARLSGGDVRVMIDAETFQLAASAVTPRQIVYTLHRLLDPGPHAVMVIVDGVASRRVTLTV